MACETDKGSVERKEDEDDREKKERNAHDDSLNKASSMEIHYV